MIEKFEENMKNNTVYGIRIMILSMHIIKSIKSILFQHLNI